MPDFHHHRILNSLSKGFLLLPRHAVLFRRFAALVCLLMLHTFQPGFLRAQSYPQVDLQVSLDTNRRLISGVLRVRVAPEDARPRDAWWFRLPPNRFLEEDPRGIAKRIAPSPIGFHFSIEDPIDPMFPGGFSAGNIQIVSVEDEAGRRLLFTKESDPDLPVGMWRGDALMRVVFAPGSSGREIKVHFVTTLPERHVDGWSDVGIVAEQWHPLLLGFQQGAWVRDAFSPAGAEYQLQVKLDRAGWLKVGEQAARKMEGGSTLITAPTGEAQRVYPLIYVPSRSQLERHTTLGHYQIFFEEGNERIANTTLDISEQFAAFAQRRYGFLQTQNNITFLQSDMGTGEITTSGNTIIIPTMYFKNSSLLDRVYAGKLARALAEIWFGEQVWANRNTDAWLHLGLTGFLALEYFEYTYGWDAPVHDLMDWLSPRYREHFFESKTLNQIRSGGDVPLTVPIYYFEFHSRAMVAVYQKAPLVIRALKFTIGEESFNEGLRRFYETYSQRQASIRGFQEAMEEAHGQPLDWFFDAWFRGTTRMDYALGDWESEPTPDGYKLSVELLRLEAGIMPVAIEISLEDGRKIRRKWDGKDERVTLEVNLPAPVESITLDPQEYLLETDRLNNHSSRDIRWRPFYDWSKEREMLVTIVARIGGNAIDGNTVGVGTNIKINSRNTLTVIPIYGENTREVLFEADYSSNFFFGPDTALQLQASKIGGRRTFSTGVRFIHSAGGHVNSSSTYAFNFEEVDAASLGTAADEPIQQPGNTNNISLFQRTVFGSGEPYSADLTFELEHSQPAIDSDFKYTSFKGVYGQQLDFHVNHALRFELIRGLIDGKGPIQKQHLLGDPLVLRGFPRTIGLVSDNIAALRLEYQFVATRKVFGETMQNRKLTLLFFGDIGKGWNNGETFDEALTRRDVGVGFTMDLSLLNTLNFPLRMELAYPVGDPEYKDRQVILLQALSFF